MKFVNIMIKIRPINIFTNSARTLCVCVCVCQNHRRGHCTNSQERSVRLTFSRNDDQETNLSAGPVLIITLQVM